MTYQSVGVANDSLDKDKEYSFLESLSLSPRDSITTLVPREQLGLFPNPPNSVVPRSNPATAQKAALRVPPAVSTTPKPSPSPLPAVPTRAATSATPRTTAPKTVTMATRPTHAGTQRSHTQLKGQYNATASANAQANCLAQCHKTNTLANRVAVHILEFLTTVKTTPDGFDSLAHEFLDTVEILFSIESGLSDVGDHAQKLPADMVSELDSKFRVTFSDFQALDYMVNKLLDLELGKTSRIKRGWGKMFGEHDLTKYRTALSRTREALRMSALVFQWNLGDEKIDRDIGIGFTGLAAALDRLDRLERKTSEGTKPIAEKPRDGVDSFSSSSTAVEPSPRLAYSPQSLHHQQQPLPPVPGWPGRSSSNLQQDSSRSPLSPLSTFSGMAITSPSEYQYHSAATVLSNHSGSDRNPYWGGQRESQRDSQRDSFERPGNTFNDTQSHATNDSDSLLNEVGGVEVNPSKVVRFTADPSTMPRCTPRSSGDPEAGNMRAALVSAIRSRNHKAMEQMLDRGVPANTGPDLNALKEAILAYDTESVRLLLLYGADPNDPDRHGITPLFAAVEKSFMAGATTLLQYGADPNLAAGSDFESPLGAATMANKVGFTHLLLIYNGNVNRMMSNGNTLLIGAIQKKTPKKFIDLLLNYGCNPNAKSREGKTALFEAIQLGRADILTSLLAHNADPNLPGPKHMLWPSTYQAPCLKLLLDHGADPKKCPGIMELATSLNNIDSVRILLKAGVNPNASKDGVYTPLCTSIRDDRPDLFELLLSSGADPNTPASEYPAFKCITHHRMHFLPALVAAGADLHSPKGIVETAVKSNNMEALNWLLDQGLNPNDKNPKGHSPLTTAIVENHVDMVDLLLHRGADPNLRGQDWPVCLAVKNPPILQRILAILPEPRAFKGVIEMAVSANQLESVKLLLAAGVSVEDKNGGVFSPLTTALRENHRQIVRYLLTDGGADVNSPGEHLPVVKALRRFHGEDTEMLELLLEHGADPNLVYRGWNGIMQAVENGDADVLQLIVSRCGVDLKVIDELGRNPIKIAESRGWDEGVQIMTGVAK